jgi:hypothetical protein
VRGGGGGGLRGSWEEEAAGEEMEWLDEYEKLVIRMNTPRVVIDNAVCPTATLVQVSRRPASSSPAPVPSPSC